MKYILTLAVSLTMLWAANTFAQGITSSGLSGKVLDKAGQPLVRATITAIHVPTGTKFGAISKADGSYRVQNVRVGGPYTVSISLLGYATQEKKDIYLNLSEELKLDFVLQEKAIEGQEVVVTANKSSLINPDRSGAEQNISNEEIANLPSISHSFIDIARVSPQMNNANSGSAGGRNNKYNNIQIDGSVLNDVFGLPGNGTPGGQAGTNPIALDALQTFQVVIAPYDVRQGGFTGAGINAVTRSGTNEFTGSAYGTWRNQSLVASDINSVPYGKFSEYTAGLRLGGPIIRDQLFFFGSFETYKQAVPLPLKLRSSSADSSSSFNQLFKDSVTKVFNFLQSKYGYDAGINGGNYDDFSTTTPNNKLFARIDWNLSDQHRLTLRDNYVSAYNDNLSETSTKFTGINTDYQFVDKTNSLVAELTSTFGGDMGNILRAGYTTVRDHRETEGSPFPFVTIQIGSNSIVGGTENSSMRNLLDQNVFELTDDFTLNLGENIFTFGTHNEFFSFKNLFVQNVYGNYLFASISDFLIGKVKQYQLSYSLHPDDPNANYAADWSANQYGLYAQDEWTGIKNLKLTVGVRVDIPVISSKASYNPVFDSTYKDSHNADVVAAYNLPSGLSTDKMPSGNLLFSPRLGFNYDLMGDKTVQLRGGLGLFTGRIPYVWLSNQVSNTGMDFGRINITTNLPAFSADPNNQPGKPGSTNPFPAIKTSEIDITSPNFKMPQLMRLDIAADNQLPMGFVGTIEGIYSKTFDDIRYQDINLKGQVGTSKLDGRPLYGTYAASGTGVTVNKVNSAAFTNVIYLSNTSDGYQYSLTFQLQRQFAEGWLGSLAYTYGHAMDENSGVSSTAFSQYQFNVTQGDPNHLPLTTSNFDLRHRILASLSYKINEGSGLSTTISGFYNGQSGRPFSYVYNGDLNADGSLNNDLVYIPKDANDIILADPTKWAALDAFINNDPYLSTHRGQIAERNGAREPWQNEFDLRIAQDFNFTGTHGFQVVFDLLNVLNALNKNWGQINTVTNQSFQLLTFTGIDAASGKPKFSYTNLNSTPFALSVPASRWQGDISIRYYF
jgi:hypothetical protein